MRGIWVVPACLLALAIPGSGQDDRKPTPVCAEAAKRVIPVGDEPPLKPYMTLTCHSPLNAYYGARGPGAMREVRWCAFAARSGMEGVKEEDRDAFLALEAPAALAMMYARGDGVKADLGLAEKFACEIQGGWDDGSGIAGELETARVKGASTVPLDVCKDAPGRQLNYVCLLIERERVETAMAVEERRFEAGTTAAERAAFARLTQARAEFLEAHGAEEPTGTTGLVQTAMREENETAEAWVQSLKDLREGRLPRFSPAEYAAVDKELNEKYGEARKNAAEICKEPSEGCTTAEQIRAAERAWLKYREAWVAYGALRWPAVSGDAWRGWVARDRAAALDGVY